MAYRTTVVAFILILLACPATADNWKTLDGMGAPEVSAPDWLNVGTGQTSRAALEGKVWLLTFFGIH